MSDEITVPIDDLRDLFMGALVFTSKDAARPVLGYVQLIVADSQLKATATDSYGAIEGTLSNVSGSLSALVHRDDITKVVSALKGYKTGHVTISLQGSAHVCFTLPDSTMTLNNTDLQFPNLEGIKPSGNPVGVEVVGINVAHLVRLGKVPTTKVGRGHPVPTVFRFYGALKPFIVTVPHPEISWEIVLMPIKHDKSRP